jgi:type I restriction enzyme R subunit
MSKFTESDVEEAALYYFEQLGYTVLGGPDIAPGESGTERSSYADVVLGDRLRSALIQLNPQVPPDEIQSVIQQVLRSETQNLYDNNQRFHRLLTEGVPVSYPGADGRTIHDQAWLIDWNNPDQNDWLVVNQFTVIENHTGRQNSHHRPDVVVFVNGLPLAVIELKNAADETANIDKAFNQLQTYKRNIPSLFTYNEMLVVSDGITARLSSLTAERDRFMPWRIPPHPQSEILPFPNRTQSKAAEPSGTYAANVSQNAPELEVLISDVFERSHLLDLIRYFVVFEVDGDCITKKIAGYHQYHAVNKAVVETVKAIAPEGDKKVGIIWHTQGSGKSLSMAFYAGKIIQHPALANPTLVILTDRNDLDDQLFGTFSKCTDLLRQTPTQAIDRADLKAKLQVASGGVIFTTIQKFSPEDRGGEYEMLSDRRNIIFIADEAHRSQYGLNERIITRTDKATGEEGAYRVYGFARFLEEVRGLPQKNLALEVLRKLLNDEIRVRSRRNVVQSRQFSEMLESTIRRYQNRSIESAQVIQELINLAQEVREAAKRGETLGLTEDELAFYDALEVNDSAVQILGDDVLKAIARDLVEAVRKNVTIDWTERETVRAKMRSIIKRLLRKHGYPPDKQAKATETVIAQAESLCKDWAA